MPVRENDSIENFLPPHIDVSCGVKSSQRQSPLLRPINGINSRDIFDSRIEYQNIIRLVLREVVFDVLSWDPVGCERSVGESRVGERHCDVWDISTYQEVSRRIESGPFHKLGKSERLTLGSGRLAFACTSPGGAVRLHLRKLGRDVQRRVQFRRQ